MKTSLRGIRVLNTAGNLSGPLASAKLRQFGADVTKIEGPQGDALNHAFPKWYEKVNEGQEVRCLDLKAESSYEEFVALAINSDVLITAHRPSTLARLGLGSKYLHKQNSQLCIVNIVGYAQSEVERAGHDLNFQGIVGTFSPPEMPHLLLADYVTAENVVQEIMRLLYLRDTRGEERLEAEVSMVDSIADYVDPLNFGATHTGGLLKGSLPGYGIYRCADGWAALGALEPQFQLRLKKELDLESLERQELEKIFTKKPVAEWVNWARERDIPLTKIKEEVQR